MAAPVPHVSCALTSCSQGCVIAVAEIMNAYSKAAKKIAKIINVNAFLLEKSNSSAACGTLSNPTYAHGAIATMEIIAANADFSVVNSGCMFSIPAPGLAPTQNV